MFFKSGLGAEDVVAFVTSIPMLLLLVFQAAPALAGGPAGITPATFDFVGMGVAVVEVLPDSVVVKGSTAACRHFWMGDGEGWRGRLVRGRFCLGDGK